MQNIEKIVKSSRGASYELASLHTEKKNSVLRSIVGFINERKEYILAENRLDLQNMTADRIAFRDRLTLTAERIEKMADGAAAVIGLPDPVGQVTLDVVRPDGLHIKRVRAPLGVAAIIYEARPNVTLDAAALCLKSGNAVILRGGSASIRTNVAIYETVKEALAHENVNPDAVQMITETDRKYVSELLSYDKYVDVVIPRGGEKLKSFILSNSKIPVIASAGGNCHVYVEKSADLELAKKIAVSAKISRPSVCNAEEHLLVDRAVAKKFLPSCVAEFKKFGVEVSGNDEVKRICPDVTLCGEESYYIEYLDLKISVKIVDGLKEAIAHINEHGTKHSECIVSEDKQAVDAFFKEVDAAAVYANASTRFTDGFEFGFGAEIGISTGKLHARGPLGLEQLTSEKYVIEGRGQIR